MKKRSISSQIVSDTAKDMGFKVEILNKNKNLFIVKHDNKEVLFKSNDCGINTSLSLKLCDDKELTYNILESKGIRTAKSIYLGASEIKNINLNKLDIEYPLVVKPIDGAHGDGVYTDIKNIDELNITINKTIKHSKNIIIQQHIQGDEHRILVIGDKVIYGIKRIPAYVIGDGKLTIKELILLENKNILRGSGYDKPTTIIDIDDNLIAYINKYYNYKINSIPNDDENITLRGISNIGAGGVPQNVSEKLGIEFKKECIKIAKSLGLKMAGIDIITKDLSVSLDKSEGAVLEVGATPGFGGDKEATGINPAEHLLNFVFNKGKI